MKWCVPFPEESVLVVRPCLNTICAGVKPAAKLLSVLLYRYSIRQEHKEDAENINEARATKGEEANQDTTFRIYRKQAQLVTDMCNEITEKTLHDVAVPTLQLLGFLDVDESSPIHCYDVHQDIVTEALAALKQGPKQLEKFLISHLQLEKFLITIPPEKVLINKKFFQFNKKYFQLALEKVLIANRNSSNNKRGRKPSSEASSVGVFEDPQISIEISNKITEEETERESTAPESDTPTVSPPGVGALALSLPSDTQSQQGDAYGYDDAHNNLNPDRRGPGGNYLVPGEHIQQTTRHQVLASGHQSVTSSEQDTIGEHRQPPAFHRESADGQLEQTTPTPTPAQATPPTSEQAASGQAAQQTLQAPEKRQSAKVEPLAEPDMSGKWSHEKCVEYAEWCNKRRYTDKMREEQMKAAQAIHKNDTALTLEQFKQAYDERNDAWWQEHKGKLHVNDMKAKGASGIDRVHEMLQRIEDAATRSRPRQLNAVPRVRVFSSYDDPNFRSDQDFYPVEGGSYATAVV